MSMCKTRTLNDVIPVRLPAFETDRLVDSLALAPEREGMSDGKLFLQFILILNEKIAILNQKQAKSRLEILFL